MKLQNSQMKFPIYRYSSDKLCNPCLCLGRSKAFPLHTMEALGGVCVCERGVAPIHS